MARTGRYLLTGYLCLLLLLCLGNCRGEKRTIQVASFLPMTGPLPVGIIILPALNMALKSVNSNDSVLPDYQLQSVMENTKCDPGLGTKFLYDFLYAKNTTTIIYGPGCSPVAQPVAEIAKLYNLAQVSYAGSSPALSDRQKYSSFYRLYPSESSFNAPRLAIIQYFEWNTVATIHQTADVFSLAMKSMTDDFRHYNITLLASEQISDDQDPTVSIQYLKEKDARIILLSSYEDIARRVICAAARNGLMTLKHVWFFMGWYSDNWWSIEDPKIECNPQEMSSAMANITAFSVSFLTNISDTRMTSTGMSASTFQRIYNEEAFRLYNRSGWKTAGFAWDAFWTIAFALDKTEKQLSEQVPPAHLYQFNYNNTLVANAILDNLGATDFMGVTGKVEFSEKGDRIMTSSIQQFQEDRFVLVATYHPKDKTLRRIPDSRITWPNNGSKPVDAIYVEVRDREISLPLFFSIALVIAACLAMSIFFLRINVRYRHIKFIKMSSPNMNNLIILGSVITYGSVLLFGMTFVPLKQYQIVCKARIWLLSFGYSFAFGAMFFKTWRVHKIFANLSAKKVAIPDSKLAIRVCVLIVIDVIVLLTWEFVDPLQSVYYFLPDTPLPENSDVLIRERLKVCTCKNELIWTLIISIYKGLLLLFGLFLAWETRKVAITALNDSKNIGVCVYTVAATCAVIVPIILATSHLPNIQYAFFATAMIFCATITLLVVFLPKVTRLSKSKYRNSSIRNSMKRTLSMHSQKDAGLSTTVGSDIVDVKIENGKLKKSFIEKENQIMYMQRELEMSKSKEEDKNSETTTT